VKKFNFRDSEFKLFAVLAVLIVLIFSVLLPVSAEEIALPEYDYDSFQLDNGLNVMVFPDHDIPLLRLSIYYDVGSIDEPENKTGISHFLEHSMFLGTEAVPKGKIDDLINSVGGSLNAATSFDYTYYYHEVPSSMLELVMALEADRMTNLKFDEEEIAREKEVIKQERRMRTENNIFSNGFEKIKAAAFAGAPLEHSVIGWMEDIENISVRDLKEYYKKYYSPNNALLVVSGDVQTSDVKELAEKYYSDIEKQQLGSIDYQFPEQESEIVKKVYLETRVPYALMLYKVPPGDHKDIISLDIFLDILANQQNSRLKDRLQKEESLILSTGAFLYQLRVPSFALVYFIPREGKLVDKAQTAYEEVINELFRDGITEDEFEIVKKQYQKSLIYSQKDINQTASSAALNELRFGKAELLKEKINILNSLNREDIIETARKYFRKSNRTRGYILPKSAGDNQ